MRAVLPCVLVLLLQSPAAAQDLLVTDVQKLANSQNNDDRFAALTGILRDRGVTFTVETFALDKPAGAEPRRTGRNIVATFGEGGEDIVLGGHYDAARLADGSLSRGAVDNAASSIMLAGVAQALSVERPAARVRVVWFDMEEIGLVGITEALPMVETALGSTPGPFPLQAANGGTSNGACANWNDGYRS